MKHIWYIFIFVSLISLISCEKVIYDYSTGDKELIDVNLQVKATSDVPNLSSPDLASAIGQLTFVVYKETGSGNYEETARATQYAGDQTFGRQKFKLAPGSYKTLVIGSKAAFLVRANGISRYNNARMVYYQSGVIPQYQTSDTFVDSAGIDVKSSLTQEYTLERVVGKIELQIQSDIPYQITLKNEAIELLVNELKPSGTIGVPYTQAILNPSAMHELYILRTDEPLQLEVAAGNVSQSMSVAVEKNKRTLIQGNLNSLTAQIGLNVVLDNEWSSDTTRVGF